MSGLSQYPEQVDSFAVHQDNVNEAISAATINKLQDAIISIQNRFNVSGLLALPATAGPAGSLCVVNKQWYISDGTTWSQIGSGAQTINANVTFGAIGTNNSPSYSVLFNYYNGTTLGTSSFYVDAAGGFNFAAALKLSGSLLQVRGVTTQSTFGVATGVRSVSDIQLTTSTATNVLVYSSPLAGNYELKGSLRAAQACNLTLSVSYTDVGGAVTQTLYSNQAVNAGYRFSILPFFFNAVSSGAITVTVTSSVANALYVSATLEGK